MSRTIELLRPIGVGWMPPKGDPLVLNLSVDTLTHTFNKIRGNRKKDSESNIPTYGKVVNFVIE